MMNCEKDKIVATPCPTCKNPAKSNNPNYPFCTQRCQLVDLGKWFDGKYNVPGETDEDHINDPDD